MKRVTAFVTALGLTIALSTSTAVIVPEPSYAFDLRKAGKKMRKNFGKAGKKIGRGLKKPGTKRLIQGVGAALIIGGIAGDSPAAAIIGVALVAAPEIIKKDIARSYGDDLRWSSCTRCLKRKPRVVNVPGRDVNKAKQQQTVARVKEDIKDVQLALKELGLYKKRIDGDFGPGTRAGVKEFQRSLGSSATGILTAEQRYRLFIQAEQKGYTRQAVLDKIEESEKTVVNPQLKATPAVIVAPQVPAIAEYLLAKSQFDSFSSEYLQSGSQAAVTEANLLPDGKIELMVKDASGQTTREVTGIISEISVNPHSLSDQWIRVVYKDGTMSKPLILNTRDDFASTEEAAKWMNQARNRISILEKLTEVAPETVIAKAPEGSIGGSGNNVPSPSNTEPGQHNAGKDGRIVIAQRQPPTSGEPSPNVITDAPDGIAGNNAAKNGRKNTSPDQKPAPTIGADAPKDTSTPQNKAGSDGRIVIAKGPTGPVIQPTPINLPSSGKSAGTITGFDAPASGETCRQNIYVSFQFPASEDPISHYNITPPDGTIMVDNGDSTAYFTGSCIQGQYDFSYVYIKEAKAKADWKHFEREGAFQIASNSEQCSIDLNTPDGSASLQCF